MQSSPLRVTCQQPKNDTAISKPQLPWVAHPFLSHRKGWVAVALAVVVALAVAFTIASRYPKASVLGLSSHAQSALPLCRRPERSPKGEAARLLPLLLLLFLLVLVFVLPITQPGKPSTSNN